MSSDTVSLDPIGYLVHKANLSKLGDIAHLPNMSGQRNLSQVNKQDQTLGKKNVMKTNNLTGTGLKKLKGRLEFSKKFNKR